MEGRETLLVANFLYLSYSKSYKGGDKNIRRLLISGIYNNHKQLIFNPWEDKIMPTNQDFCEPIFCSVCGCRIGWADDSVDDAHSMELYCNDCVNEEREEVNIYNIFEK